MKKLFTFFSTGEDSSGNKNNFNNTFSNLEKRNFGQFGLKFNLFIFLFFMFFIVYAQEMPAPESKNLMEKENTFLNSDNLKNEKLQVTESQVEEIMVPFDDSIIQELQNSEPKISIINDSKTKDAQGTTNKAKVEKKLLTTESNSPLKQKSGKISNENTGKSIFKSSTKHNKKIKKEAKVDEKDKLLNETFLR